MWLYNSIMATVQPSENPFKSRGMLLKELGRMLSRPAVILYFVLAATKQFWIGAAVYVILRTFLLTPNGFIAWFLVVAAAGAFVIGTVSIGASAVKLRPLVRAARDCRQAGDSDGLERNLIAVREKRHRTMSRNFGLIVFPIVLLIPCGVAIMLTSGDSPMPILVRSHGKMRMATRLEQIRAEVRALEHHGIFKPLETGTQ
jgi:hypothetical protein